MPTRMIQPTPSAHPGGLLIKSILQASQRFEPDNEIVYQGAQRYRYRDLSKRVCRLANLLRDNGVEAGDTVAIADWDSHRYLEAYFAVPMIGAVLHHINIRLSDDQIVYTMNHAEDKLVFVHRDFLPLFERIGERLETVLRIIPIADGSEYESSLTTYGEYEALMDSSDAHYEFPDFDENSIATMFYTTGTTGNPKGVFFSHRQLVLHTLNLVSFCGSYASLNLFRSDDVYMPITPMFHVHAWGMPYAATMLGAKQVYPGRYDPEALLQLIEKEGVTYSHCVPTILQMILEADQNKRVDLSGWKLVIGGSAMSQGLAIKAMKRGIEVYTGYGMSETCPVLGVTHLNQDKRALDRLDQVPFRTNATVTNLVELRILDANGNPQPEDGESVGELVVRAPWLTQGYFKDPQKSEELWHSGWLHTGDIACLHPNGMLEIKDRLKDVIKTGGEWISSLELESLISQLPGVLSVAVVGITDEEWGERPYALVTTDEALAIESKDVKQHLVQFVESGRINKWWIPERISMVEDIPKTSVGKIDKRKIRQGISGSN